MWEFIKLVFWALVAIVVLGGFLAFVFGYLLSFLLGWVAYVLTFAALVALVVWFLEKR